MIKLALIDDDPIFTRVLSRAMADRDYDVVVCNSIDEGREMAARSWADAVLLDLNIEGNNGSVLIDDFRVANATTKIVILTAYGCVKSAVWAAKCGAADFVTKPIDAEEIDFVLKRALGLPAQMPELSTPPQEVREAHIIEFFEKNDRSVSPTARELAIHRRSLQRILHRLGFNRTNEPARKVTAFRRARRMMRLWSSTLSPHRKTARLGHSRYRKGFLQA